MDLHFNIALATQYRSASQIARVLTEDWLAHHMFCPICGEISIKRAEANAPVKDFICQNCKAQYELKSKKADSPRFQSTVAGGSYHTMIERITSLDNPSFFFMHYNHYEVNNLIIVPKCFFTPSVIEKRHALTTSARRAGWEGCNILMGAIPSTAKIPIIFNGAPRPINEVVTHYNRIYNLQTQSLENRTWLVDILHLIERLDESFTLSQMYSFVEELKIRHPNNHHIEDKIRQQLQFLRDKGLIEFKGQGLYKKVR
ncbi:DpnI domain-containing protein [Prevotella sp.]|uniref:DpnI domain-containing protein n=1 Tax=Prevotella sp. TaxID=59823 RepID=UPI002F952DB7